MEHLRMCCACRNMMPQRQMIRVVRTPEGVIKVDADGKANGRGCYICRNDLCIQKGIKTRFINRAFGCDVPMAVYDEVKKAYDEQC